MRLANKFGFLRNKVSKTNSPMQYDVQCTYVVFTTPTLSLTLYHPKFETIPLLELYIIRKFCDVNKAMNLDELSFTKHEIKNEKSKARYEYNTNYLT